MLYKDAYGQPWPDGEATGDDPMTDAELLEKTLPKLMLMVGLPYSGKTTRAATLQQVVVNPDSIRMALHGQRFVAAAEPMVWAICRIMVNALFMAGHRVVILDACNTTGKRREEWLPREGDYWVQVVCCVMDDGPERCIARAKAVGDEEIIPHIDRMAEAWDLPITWKEDAHAGPG